MFRRRTDHVAEYLQGLASSGASPKTLSEYRRTLVAWQASAETPAEYLASLVGKPATLNAYRQHLSTYHTWLIRQGYAKDNPVTRVRRWKTPRTRLRTLTIPELARLIDAAGAYRQDRCHAQNNFGRGLPHEAHVQRVQAMIALGATTGLRVTELCSVETNRIDWDARTISVTGKGQKERLVQYPVPIIPYLYRWAEARDTLPDSPWHYCTSSGNRVDQRNYSRELAEAARWAGLEGVHPHLLRHSFATLQLDAGTPLVNLRDMLGHDSVKTTESYLHRTGARAWADRDLPISVVQSPDTMKEDE